MKQRFFGEMDMTPAEQLRILDMDITRLTDFGKRKIEEKYRLEAEEFGLGDQLDFTSDIQLEDFIERVEKKVFPRFMHRNSQYYTSTSNDLVIQSLQGYTDFLQKEMKAKEKQIMQSSNLFDDFKLDDSRQAQFSKDTKSVINNIDKESAEMIFPRDDKIKGNTSKDPKNIFAIKNSKDSIDRKYFNYRKKVDEFDIGNLDSGKEYYHPKKKEMDLEDNEGKRKVDFFNL